MLTHFVQRSLFVAAILFAGAVLPAYGEKIEFSNSGKDVQPKFDPQPVPNASKFINTPSPTLPSAPLPLPQNPRPDASRYNEELERKKNWIFARPEDASPSVEEVLKIKDPTKVRDTNIKPTDFLSKAVEAENSREQSSDKNLTRDRFDNRDDERSSLFPGNNQNQTWERMWGAANPDNRQLLDRSPTSMSDMWSKNQTAVSSPDPLLMQNALRNGDLKQLLEPRSTLDPYSALNDATQQPANPIVGTYNRDFKGSQSFSDQFNSQQPAIGVARSSALDGITARANTTAPVLERRTPEVRITSKPTVLPAPVRPGEIFKRPGSF